MKSGSLRTFWQRVLPQRNTLKARFMAAFLVTVLLPLLSTALYGNWVTSAIIKERAINAAYNDTRQRAVQIRDFLRGVEDDVRYLSDLDDLRKWVQAQASGDQAAAAALHAELVREFYVFARSHPAYYQVRFLDAEGQEIVRVDSDGRTVRVVPPEDLQNKAHRYYFREAMSLPVGAIYISPLDLNREHGVIEWPYKPVIRYAMPVDYLGERQGVVVINVFGNAFLHFLADGNVDAQLFLVDGEGYFLYHPNPEKRWGGPADLGTGYNLLTDYPELDLAALQAGPGEAEAAGDILVYAPVELTVRADAPSWVVVRAQSERRLLAPILAFRKAAAAILAVAILVALGMVVGFSEHLAHPILTLQRRVKHFADSGEYLPAPVMHDDEVGALTREVNRMMQLLQEQIVTLQRINAAGRQMMSQLEREATRRAILQALRESLPVRWAGLWYCPEIGCQAQLTAESGPLPSPLPEGLLQQAQAMDGCLVRQQELDIWYCVYLPGNGEHGWYLTVVGQDPDLGRAVYQKMFNTLSIQAKAALDNACLYENLARHRQRLSHLLQAIIHTQEEERKRIAYELHDGLVQDLVGVRLYLSNLSVQPEGDWQQAAQALAHSRQQLTRVLREARRLLRGLRPTVLDDLGLGLALRELARETETMSGLRVKLHLPPAGQLDALDGTVEIAAFRIVQEALANVRKHAEAQHVSIRVGLSASRLRLEIEDDGRGFDVEAAMQSKQSIGLFSMSERTNLLGGAFAIESRPGEGTRVLVSLPLQV